VVHDVPAGHPMQVGQHAGDLDRRGSSVTFSRVAHLTSPPRTVNLQVAPPGEPGASGGI
jgi:hypothetical protein